MVTTRKLTADGDFEYEEGRQVEIADQDALVQGVKVALSTLKGESLFHPSFGVDIQGIAASNETAKIAVIRSALERSQRFSRIDRIERIGSDPKKNRSFDFIVQGTLRNQQAVELGVSVS